METKGDYIRRKCLERLNTNPNLGVLEFQDGIFVGMEYNEANKYSEEEVFNILLNYQKNYPNANNETGLKHWFKHVKK